MAEARIDLHAHTTASEDTERVALPHGAEFTVPFHPVLRPLEAYDLALERGMTHVTFTDHNTIEGCLQVLEQHPDPSRLVIGEEITCYTGDSELHVGVYGHDESLHRAIHRGAERTDAAACCLRYNVWELLDFCDAHGLLYDWKHPVWQRDGTPASAGLLVRLFERFPHIEAVNGTRCRHLNELAQRLARQFGRLGIAFTAGSDTHSDQIGRCYTRTEGSTAAEVLESLRAGRCEPVGPHGSHRLLEYDIRRCIASNLSQRAGLFVALADDWSANLPQLLKEATSVGLSALVAFAVVHEQARQRKLARDTAALFDAPLREVPAHGPDLVASD